MANLDLIPMDNPVPGMIDAAAERYGVDRNLAHVVAQMESNYNPRAVSKAGAQGVMQLMPATARDLGVADPLDPAQNIEGGVKYLAQLSSRYNGDPRLTLAAYNAGPGAVDRAGGVPPYAETQNYVALGTRRLDSAAQHAPLDLIPMESTPGPARAQTSAEILPPLTEPPEGKPPQPEEKSVGGFLNNLATSAYNNLLSPIVHPGQTLAGISNLLEGMGEMTGNVPVPGMHGRQAIEGLTNLYTQRYGSWQGFKDAWYKDPVGMMGDLAIAADGLGLGKAAVQDFVRASGLTDAAMAARDTLAGAIPDTGKVGAAAAAGVKAVPGAATAGFRKAFDPALILSGPHSMVIGAKLEFAKQVAKAAKDAWKGAGEAPEIAEPEEAAAVATPAAAPAVAKTPGQVYAESQGHDWASLSANDRQLMDQIAQAQANVAAQAPSQPPVTPPAAPAAPPLTPQELTQLETGRPPSRQSEAAQQAAAETLATAQAAPEAPAPTPEPAAAPVEPAAPQVAKPAAQGLPPETAQMTPEDAEEVFQQQKARIEEGMTPATEPQAGVRLEPLPEEVPPHYQGIQQVEGTSAATRAFLKDKRIADYVLGKGITPEQFEAMPLDQQNKLIREAPAASAKGKNRPFLPRPEGTAPRAVGRYADEGIRDIVNTMRWRQAQK